MTGFLEDDIVIGRRVNIAQRVLTRRDGRRELRELVVHPGSVVLLPLLDDGRLVMERQWRYPLERVMLEFPAGKLERGEAPYTCAVRELAEETGYTARQWARAGVLHNAIAYSDEAIAKALGT